MPTMSLDFTITQMYRLIANDLLMISDALSFYRKYKKNGKSVKEFCEVLANLVDVESENFEEIKNIGKLSYGEGQSLTTIVWDYFHDVVMKHVLDDLSQYPFWAAKVAVTTRAQVFGIPAIESWFNNLQITYAERGPRGIFQGALPYLTASVIINYKYVFRMTNKFVLAVMAKIPHNTSKTHIINPDDSGGDNNCEAISASKPGASLAAVRGSGVPIGGTSQLQQPKRRGSKKGTGTVVKETFFEQVMSNAVVGVLSHPFLVLSVNMVTNPALHTSYCFAAYLKMIQNNGLWGMYKGIRTRFFLTVIPLSPILLLGISDSLMYRRMLGQGTKDTTGGLSSVLREIVSKEGGGVVSLLNYGLITLVQLIPGFVSFLTVRTVSRFLFGRSIARGHQISRRKEIIESHLNTKTKKIERIESSQALAQALGGVNSGNNNAASGSGGSNPSGHVSLHGTGHTGGLKKSRSAHFSVPATTTTPGGFV